MQKTLLVILDGFGIASAGKGNAISQAKAPFLQKLFQHTACAKLWTHGEAVGLPAGTMGNSEVGHMSIGSGRVIWQDLSRINREIREGSFFENPELVALLKAPGKLHLIGLLSDGGVHSHIDHLRAILKASDAFPDKEIVIHPILDGRDTPPGSAEKYLEALDSWKGRARIGSISGRYYAMDRDHRWERVEKAYRAMCGLGPKTATPNDWRGALQDSFAREVTDEFFEPLTIDPAACLAAGDACLFFNFRADRMRQLVQVIAGASFAEFERPVTGLRAATFSRYQEDFPFPVLFPKQDIKQILADVIADNGLKQLRIAETEKYAHVTYFLNGGQEQVRKNEERILIDSPKDVATYDQKPEMSLPEVARSLVKEIQSSKHDLIISNFANADMVGHTGNFRASTLAVQAIDRYLKEVVDVAHAQGYFVFISADHGNIEEMIDQKGNPHTQHTLNPVPLFALAPDERKLQLHEGSLCDIMPTILTTMNLPVPEACTGESLFNK